jgi:clan AA aspartic protease
MGNFKEEITLTNSREAGNARAGLISAEQVQSVTVSAIVDTGASTLIINEEIRQQLGLELLGTRTTNFADGGQKECGITEPVDIHWKNRDCSVRAVVIPGAKAILLGAIPLEDMDLMVNPVKQELVGVHGDVVEALAL